MNREFIILWIQMATVILMVATALCGVMYLMINYLTIVQGLILWVVILVGGFSYSIAAAVYNMRKRIDDL